MRPTVHAVSISLCTECKCDTAGAGPHSVAVNRWLFITGEQAHSRIFSEHAYRGASEPKELLIVPGAGHVDLYDRVNLIPWDTLRSFFTRSLGSKES